MLSFWKELKGKTCRFHIKDGGDVRVFIGEVVDVNGSFLVEKDRFGRVHFIKTNLVEQIDEIASKLGEKQ